MTPKTEGFGFPLYIYCIYIYLNCIGKDATHLLIFGYSPWVDPTVEDG